MFACVVATDGLWDSYTSQEAVDKVYQVVAGEFPLFISANCSGYASFSAAAPLFSLLFSSFRPVDEKVQKANQQGF